MGNETSTKKCIEKLQSDKYKNYAQIPEKARDSEDFMRLLVKRKISNFRISSDRLKSNKDFVMEIIELNPMILRYISPNLKNDPEVVMKAFQIDKICLKWAGAELMDNKEFVTKIVEDAGTHLQFVSSPLRDDCDVICSALKGRNPQETLKYASERLLLNRDIVKYSVKLQPESFEYADLSLRDQKKFVLKLIKKYDPIVFKYATSRLRRDKDVTLAAITQDFSLFKYYTEEIPCDKNSGDPGYGHPEVMIYAVQQDFRNLEYADDTVISRFPELVGKFVDYLLSIEEKVLEGDTGKFDRIEEFRRECKFRLVLSRFMKMDKVRFRDFLFSHFDRLLLKNCFHREALFITRTQAVNIMKGDMKRFVKTVHDFSMINKKRAETFDLVKSLAKDRGFVLKLLYLEYKHKLSHKKQFKIRYYCHGGCILREFVSQSLWSDLVVLFHGVRACNYPLKCEVFLKSIDTQTLQSNFDFELYNAILKCQPHDYTSECTFPVDSFGSWKGMTGAKPRFSKLESSQRRRKIEEVKKKVEVERVLEYTRKMGEEFLLDDSEFILELVKRDPANVLKIMEIVHSRMQYYKASFHPLLQSELIVQLLRVSQIPKVYEIYYHYYSQIKEKLESKPIFVPSQFRKSKVNVFREYLICLAKESPSILDAYKSDIHRLFDEHFVYTLMETNNEVYFIASSWSFAELGHDSYRVYVMRDLPEFHDHAHRCGIPLERIQNGVGRK